MRPRYYIICGNSLEFSHYAMRKLPNERADFSYVDTPSILQGTTNPKGFFYGTWRNKHNILEIVEMLLTRYTTVESPESIRKIYNELVAAKFQKESEDMKRNLENQELVKFMMDHLFNTGIPENMITPSIRNIINGNA